MLGLRVSDGGAEKVILRLADTPLPHSPSVAPPRQHASAGEAAHAMKSNGGVRSTSFSDTSSVRGGVSEELERPRVVSVSCGSEHCAALTDNGAVYMWGWAEHGNLGLGDCRNRTEPALVPMPNTAAGGACAVRMLRSSGAAVIALAACYG